MSLMVNQLRGAGAPLPRYFSKEGLYSYSSRESWVERTILTALQESPSHQVTLLRLSPEETAFCESCLRAVKGAKTPSDSLTELLLNLRDSTVTNEELRASLEALPRDLLTFLETAAGERLREEPRLLLRLADTKGLLLESLIEGTKELKDIHLVEPPPLIDNRAALEEQLYQELAAYCLKNHTDLHLIIDKKLKLAIATLMLQSDIPLKGSGIDQDILVQLASKEAARNRNTLPRSIHTWGIEKAEDRFAIAMLAAQSDECDLSENIENFGLDDPVALREIALLAAAHDFTLPAHIHKYLLTEESDRLHVAQIAAAFSGGGLSKHVKDFAISSEDDRLALAKIAAASQGGATSRFIANYEIHNAEALKEIALIAAQDADRGIGPYFQNYGFTDQGTLSQLAHIAARHNGYVLLETLPLYHIADRKDLIALLKEAIQTRYLDDLETPIKRAGIEDPSLIDEIAFHHLLLFDNWKTSPFLAKLPAFLKERFGGLLDVKRENRWELGMTIIKAYGLLLLPAEHRADSMETLNKIASYRNFSMALYLTKLFCNRVVPTKLEAYQRLATNVPLTLPMIFVAVWDGREDSPLRAYLQSQKERLKDVNSGLLPAWLNTLRALEEAPTLSAARKLALATFCIDNSAYLKLVEALCSLGKSALLERNLTGEELASAVREAAEETGFLDFHGIEDFAIKFAQTFGSLRVPNALFTYISRLQYAEPSLDLRKACQNFARSVLENSFTRDRYNTEGHPHLKKLATFPALYSEWQKALPPRPVGELTLIDTDLWPDLFLSGTEVTGSCQRIDGQPHLNKCLLNYIIDGKIRMIALKNKAGRIVARSIVKLLWHPLDKRPVLFFEQTYPRSFEKDQLIQLAEEKAKALGVPLYQASKEGEELISFASRAPFEYEDGLMAVTKGYYHVKGSRSDK